MDASFSSNHTIVLVEGGYVFTLGSNSAGQRGVGNCSNILDTATLVELVKDRYITVNIGFDLNFKISTNICQHMETFLYSHDPRNVSATTNVLWYVLMTMS